MPEYLPYGRQWVDEADVDAVVDVLRSDFLTTGPAIEQFESGLAEATTARHVVAVNSGTSALHAMYSAAGVGPGTEVVTSPLTFAATANAALYLGATVRFADVELDTGCVDPTAADHAIGDRTHAVVAVDFAGHPADYDSLRVACSRRGVRLLADAAHSLGASSEGRSVGVLADASALSFHPVKPITTAEGGAVVTHDAALAEAARRFRTHGITKDPAAFARPDEGPWWYEQVDLGFNYRLTDLQAALGTQQLSRLRSFVARRRSIAAVYDAEFGDLATVRLPTERAGVESGWHLYVIRTRDAERRRAVFEALRANGIGVQVHYIPVYWHPYYEELGFRRGLCPKAEAFYRSAISLPIFPRMSDEDVQRTVEVVRSVVSELT